MWRIIGSMVSGGVIAGCLLLALVGQLALDIHEYDSKKSSFTKLLHQSSALTKDEYLIQGSLNNKVITESEDKDSLISHLRENEEKVKQMLPMLELALKGLFQPRFATTLVEYLRKNTFFNKFLSLGSFDSSHLSVHNEQLLIGALECRTALQLGVAERIYATTSSLLELIAELPAPATAQLPTNITPELLGDLRSLVEKYTKIREISKQLPLKIEERALQDSIYARLVADIVALTKIPESMISSPLTTPYAAGLLKGFPRLPSIEDDQLDYEMLSTKIREIGGDISSLDPYTAQTRFSLLGEAFERLHHEFKAIEEEIRSLKQEITTHQQSLLPLLNDLIPKLDQYILNLI